MMRRTLAFLVWLFVCTSASAQGALTWQSLFDGKTLNGWTVSGGEAKDFFVQDGALRVNGRYGWIRTDRKYANFAITFDVRFLTPDGTGNSGFFLRSPEDTIFARGWPGKSFEVEIRDMTNNRGLAPPWMGQVLRLANAPEGVSYFDPEAAAKAYQSTGEWHHYEVRADGSTITVFINGYLISKAYGVTTPEGHIGFQAEEGSAEFRNVRIFEYEPATSATEFRPMLAGSDLSGWIVSAPEYAGNFSAADGVLSVQGKGGWLRTKQLYADFVMRFEYQLLTDDTDSGVFVRVGRDSPNYEAGWPSDSVEVQLRRSATVRPVTSVPGDPRWTGAILRHGRLEGLNMMDSAAALKAYQERREWNSCEIEVAGEMTSVKLNGNLVSRAFHTGNAQGGIIGFQAASGRAIFRAIEVQGRAVSP